VIAMAFLQAIFKTSAFYTLAKTRPVLGMALAIIPLLMLSIAIAAKLAGTFLEFAIFAAFMSLISFVALAVVCWHEKKAN
jgi:hypothetical protein